MFLANKYLYDFLSLSPQDHPLPTCLNDNQFWYSMGGERYRTALFPSNGMHSSSKSTEKG